MPEARLSPDALAARIVDLFGDDLREAGGIVHVAAVWAAPDGRLLNLLIGPDAPASATDRFVLDLVRARADAIVTTGAILRAEPELVHEPAGPDREALLGWREAALGREAPPLLAVLSRGEDVPFGHPALRAWARPVLFTGEAAASALGARCREAGIELMAHPEPSLEALLRWLREQRGCGVIAVEAGPSTTRSLYEPGAPEARVRVDELVLSVCRSPSLPGAALGEPFVQIAGIRAAGLELRSESAREEESGPWSFQRWVRAPS